ncbi:Cupredoxin [Abortiporus biennis]
MLSLLRLTLAVSAVVAPVFAEIHNVVVGNANGQTIYTPEAISANPGDQVVFQFQQKNHTATQSSFANPCGALDGGFDSGFMPVPANQTDNFPTYTITVNDTKPIWVFCNQAANTPNSHCGAGMVFAVNCGQDGQPNSFTNFKNAALAIGASLKAQATATTPVTTAAYGGVTIPAAPEASVVTVTVTVEASHWTTTYSSYPGSPNPTPVSLTGTTHKVVVGGANGELTYDPPFVQAQPRDQITFEFHEKNHTATLSSFDAPCRANPLGLDSGFMPVAANSTTFPTWTVTVNDTNPLWFYCRQHKPDGSAHCGAGMVFAVNPVQTSARNFTAFQNLAIALNGTNATGAATSGGSTTSQAPTSGASSSAASNVALGMGSLFALVALLL